MEGMMEAEEKEKRQEDAEEGDEEEGGSRLGRDRNFNLFLAPATNAIFASCILSTPHFTCRA